MNRKSRRENWLLEDLQDLLMDEESLLISDFEEVAETFVKGYSKFLKLGIPGHTIGLAMLGATINFYSMFGIRDELPDLFRSLADKMEDDSPHH